MTTAIRLDRLEEQLGQLVARHERAQGLDAYRAYRDDPCGFAERVLGLRLWSKQREMLELCRSHRLVRVRSAQGIGKTHAAAAAILWWLYTRVPSVVIALTPTERQGREQLWREVSAMFLNVPELPGDLRTQGLELGPRHYARAFATRESGTITGFHSEHLLVALDECHALEPFVWESLFRIISGARNQALAIGNPGPPAGRWYEINSSPGWAPLTITALEHPNLTGTEPEIPGAISQVSIDDMAREYGTGSPTYRAAVLAEFAVESEEQLVRIEWVRRANELHRTGALERYTSGQPLLFSLDVARFGSDHSALCIMQGPVVRGFTVWHGLDTQQSVHRLMTEVDERAGLAARLRISAARRPGFGKLPSLVIDAGGGLGAGPVDVLKRHPAIVELGIVVEEFNGGSKAKDSSRFINKRAERYWHLRKRLEAGTLTLPENARLSDELVSTKWGRNERGLIKIEPKEELRARLGRSPDLADALSMAVGPEARYTVGGFTANL